MASRLAQQHHVRFASELTVPPADRQRKDHSFYPKVAQEKGRSERQSSFDLFWRWDKLSSVPHTLGERQHRLQKWFVTQVLLKERSWIASPGLSRGTPRHRDGDRPLKTLISSLVHTTQRAKDITAHHIISSEVRKRFYCHNLGKPANGS